jgi:EVE domain
MNTWIYQVNPAKFNVNGCLAEAPERVAWSVSRYQKDMKPNDQVFIWRSKSDGTHGAPGIIAECAVDSLVTRMPADSFTRPFFSWHRP